MFITRANAARWLSSGSAPSHSLLKPLLWVWKCFMTIGSGGFKSTQWTKQGGRRNSVCVDECWCRGLWSAFTLLKGSSFFIVYLRLPLDIFVSPYLLHHLYLPLPHHLLLPPHFFSSTSPSPPNSKRGSAPNGSVRIAYWLANRLIICLFLAEKEICWRKDKGKTK